MKTMTIKLPESLFAEIASDAKSRNVTKSEIVRQRLTRKFAGAKRVKSSMWDRMEDLVIRSDSLSADLSSNKAHMKKYGKNRSHR